MAQVKRILAIPIKRADTRLIDYLTREEMQALLDAPAPNTRDGIRDRAMLHVAYSAGLRVSELVGLRLDNLAFNPQLSIHVLGKGRRERALPLWRESATALRAWLSLRPNGRAPEVFLNARGAAMTRSGFEYILDKHVQVARQQCPTLATKRVSSARASTLMRDDDPAIDGRHSKGGLVARSYQHTNHRNVSAGGYDDTTRNMNETTPPTLRKGHFRPPDQLIALLKGQ